MLGTATRKASRYAESIDSASANDSTVVRDSNAVENR
jgi:hypothetical protein